MHECPGEFLHFDFITTKLWGKELSQFQGFVVDIMVNRGLVGCIPQHVSEVGAGVIIKVEYKMTYFCYILTIETWY